MARQWLTDKRNTAVLGTVVGLALVAMGLFLPAQQLFFHQSDATAVAEVIGSRESCSGRYCYTHPVVRFRTDTGREVEAQARYSSTSEVPAVGSTIRVNYSIEDPTQVQVVDRQTTNYVVAAGCLAAGVLLLFVYARQLRQVLTARG